MAREKGIGRADVFAAMEALLERGLEPSTRAVQQITGGSNTTVAKYIKAIKLGAETPERQLESLPEQIEIPLRQMLAAMDELADQRTAEKSEALDIRRQEVEARWSGLLMEKEAAVQSFESEQRSNAELRLRLTAETQKLETANAELGEWKARAIKAEALNDQLNSRLVESSRRVDEIEAQLDNLERATEVQRQRDSDAHNARVSQMQQVIDTSHGNELRLTEQLGQLQRSCEKLEASLREATRKTADAEAKQAELQALVGDLSIAQTESERRATRNEAQLMEAVASREAMSERLNAAQGSLIAAQERIEQLRDSGSAESRSLIINLIEHSRRVFTHAQGLAKKTDTYFQELAIAQREIERLFGDK